MSMTSQLLQDSLTYYLTNGGAINRPTAWQVRLHTGSPGTGSDANEVTDGGYSRKAVTFTYNSSSQLVANSAELNFGTASGSYTVTHVSVWDTTNGIPLVVQRLSADKTVAAGAQAIMAAGELRIGGTI